jgi:hypothetical protein
MTKLGKHRSFWREQHYKSLRCKLCDPVEIWIVSTIKLNPARQPWNLVDQGSTLVDENKREKGTNKSKEYLSSRVSWPYLVTVPVTGDAANFMLIRRTTAN